MGVNVLVVVGVFQFPSHNATESDIADNAFSEI